MPEARRRRYFQMPAIDQPDPEPGYQHSSDEFIVPASDTEGDSVRVWCRVPSQLHAWLGDIVASRKFPFQRDGDLIRYGIYLACVQLSRIEKKVPNLQGRIDAMSRVVRQRANAASIVEHLDHLEKVMEDLQHKHAWGEILYLLAAEKRSARQYAQVEPYWGGEWLNGLENRLGSVERLATSQMDLILKDAPTMSFKPSQAVHIEEEEE